MIKKRRKLKLIMNNIYKGKHLKKENCTFMLTLFYGDRSH